MDEQMAEEKLGLIVKVGVYVKSLYLVFILLFPILNFGKN